MDNLAAVLHTVELRLLQTKTVEATMVKRCCAALVHSPLLVYIFEVVVCLAVEKLCGCIGGGEKSVQEGGGSNVLVQNHSRTRGGQGLGGENVRKVAHILLT